MLIVLPWGWTIVMILLVFSSLTQQELLFCGPKFGCDAVLKGKYSSLLGIPLAAWGLGSALLLFALLVVSLISSRRALLAMRVLGILCLIFTLASGVFYPAGQMEGRGSGQMRTCGLASFRYWMPFRGPCATTR